jgi:hypothetical protein
MERPFRQRAASSYCFAASSICSPTLLSGSTASKFKAVNNRDKPYKLERRIEQIEASIARYLFGDGSG